MNLLAGRASLPLFRWSGHRYASAHLDSKLSVCAGVKFHRRCASGFFPLALGMPRATDKSFQGETDL
jgi:hypothetical protein